MGCYRDMDDIVSLVGLKKWENKTVDCEEKQSFIDREGYKYYLSKGNIQVHLRRSKNYKSEFRKFYQGNIYTHANIAVFLNKEKKYKLLSLGENAKAKSAFWCIECEDIFYSSWNSINRGEGCPLCGRKRSAISKTNSLAYVKEVASNKYGIEVLSTEYYSNLDKLDFVCRNHPTVVQKKSWAQIQRDKIPCSFCKKEIIRENNKDNPSPHSCPKSQNTFVKQVFEKWGELYSVQGAYTASNKKIKIKCNNCGKVFEIAPKHLLSGHGCKCNKSLGEIKIRQWLIRNEYLFEEQKTFDGCKSKKSLSYDFFLPEVSVLIEYQGIQHYTPVDFFGGEDALREQQERDNIKRMYAQKHGYRLLEIDYKDSDNIDNILEMEFSNENRY